MQRKGVMNLNPRFSQTMPTDLHETLKGIAQEKGMTLTALINAVMADYAGTSDNPGFITELRTRIEKLEKEVREMKEKK